MSTCDLTLHWQSDHAPHQDGHVFSGDNGWRGLPSPEDDTHPGSGRFADPLHAVWATRV